MSVYPGDPVTVTGKTLNLEEHRKSLPTYTWNSTGGRVTGSAGGATINTARVGGGRLHRDLAMYRRQPADGACRVHHFISRDGL